MDFSLTDDQQMIRDAAADYLAEASTSEAVRQAMVLPSGYHTAVWQTIAAELGWAGLAIPEDCGGLGMGPVELMLIQEQAGQHLLCAPFFSTVCLAATWLEAIGSDEAKQELLPRIAVGELTATVAMTSQANDCDGSQLQASPVDSGWQLSGTLSSVCNGDSDLLLVFAETPEGVGLFGVSSDTAGLGIEAKQGWDATRRFHRASLDAVAAKRLDDSDHVSAQAARAAALIRIYIAAEQLGAAQRCLDLTVEYVSERKQFGRVVGGFQAVKHRCAEMMVKIEGLRSAVYGAAALAASDADPDTLRMEAAMAKALASDVLFWVSGEAIQLHGGVGFTAEYDPQLYFKRAQASKHWMGTPEALRSGIAEALL